MREDHARELLVDVERRVIVFDDIGELGERPPRRREHRPRRRELRPRLHVLLPDAFELFFLVFEPR